MTDSAFILAAIGLLLATAVVDRVHAWAFRRWEREQDEEQGK